MNQINKLIYPSLAMTLFAVATLGQSNSTNCPSELHVTPGISTVIDCALGEEFESYQWTSKDPAWLTYLSDVNASSPRIYIPVRDAVSNHIVYERRVFNAKGVISQEWISIRIEYPNTDVDVFQTSELQRTSNYSDEVTEISKIDPPYLRCEPQVTVQSGEMIEISCTGGHALEELLEYNMRFDWPPYNDSRLISQKSFEFFVRAPVIDNAMAVHVLEVFAQVPGTDQEVTVPIEIHVVNEKPTITCSDLIVDERNDIDLPCLIPDKSAKIQLLSEAILVQQGIYTSWPRLNIPEVTRDTSYAITVRLFVKEQVTVTTFNVEVRDNSGPEEFGIECSPVMSEIYEGTPDFEIMCKTMDAPTNELSWTWSAEGDSRLDRLEPDIVNGAYGTALFRVPSNIDQDEKNTYTVTATHDAGGTSNRVFISITVLDKPVIMVSCDDATVKTGDPLLRLMCTASNTKDIPLDYLWSWNPTDLLSDVNTGTPLFETPVIQQELVEEYVYEVTVSADFADSPATPTKLVVTVLKNHGPVEMTCNSPIEVYEGTPDIPLDCSVTSTVSENLMWSWDLISDVSEDRLIQGLDGAPPVFQTPVLITKPTTWIYLIQADDPPHYEKSVPQEVQISVLPRPTLTLECPKEVEVFVGQAPYELDCKVQNDQNFDLVYRWNWNPSTRLSNATIANPLFDVPLNQRAASYTYSYIVAVEADYADPVEASVDVTVLNPEIKPAEELLVTLSELDFGVVRPQGEVRLDPSTEQISGQFYEGIPNVGRMIFQAEDSLTMVLELLDSVRLIHEKNTEQTLVLNSEWSYSESCDLYHSNAQASQIVQFQLGPGACHVLRLGGTVALDGAMQGMYSGDVIVNMRVNEFDEIKTIPVSVTVGPDYKAVVLGPSGADIVPVQTDKIYGDERLHIWPSVLEFSSEKMIALFDIYNPSLALMEVHVAIPDTSGQVIAIYPKFALLNSGENMQIRVKLIKKLDDQEYPDMINVTVTPRSYYDQNLRPDQSSPAKITFQVPVIYTK